MQRKEKLDGRLIMIVNFPVVLDKTAYAKLKDMEIT